jgi:hypothetical protein
MKLELAQLVALASGAGFSGDDLVTAVSIALAESGGNPQAYNPERAAGTPQGYGSFGLWQIYLKAHPEFAGSNLFDPATNAAAAFSVYQRAGGSFRPWSTFGNNAYMAHVDAVTQALPSSPDVVASDTPPDDGTPPDPTSGSGAPPSDGGMVGLVTAGALVVWAAAKFFNG